MTELVLGTKYLAVVAIACIASWLATRLSIPCLRAMLCIDIPNSRSSHTVPTPRGGGIGIIFGCGAGLITSRILGLQLPAPALLVGTVLVALVGFADDLQKGLPVLLRLSLQLVAAGLVIWGTGGLSHLPLPEPLNVPLGALAIPVALLWIVGVTNIYNFLDGIDGYTTTQGLLFGGAMVCLAPLSPMAVGGLVVCGACLGFLPFNWRPAKVFMGDVGSTALGFLAATLPFQVSMEARGASVFATAIFLWFFLADGAFTLLLRLFRREKIWTPHRSHLYQRLAIADLRHDQIVLVVAMGAVPLACIAILAQRLDNPALEWLALALAVAIFAVYRYLTAITEEAYAKSPAVPRPQPASSQTQNPEPIVEVYAAAICELPGIDLLSGDLNAEMQYRVRIAMDADRNIGHAFLQALDHHGIVGSRVSTADVRETLNPGASSVASPPREFLEMELPTVSISTSERSQLIASIQECYHETFQTEFVPKPR